MTLGPKRELILLPTPPPKTKINYIIIIYRNIQVMGYHQYLI